MKSVKVKLLGNKFLIIVLMFFIYVAFSADMNAQNVAITDDDGYTVNPAAMLDVKSVNKGLLVPRVALVSTTDPVSGTKPEGLLVWNTSTSGSYPDPGFYNWSGSNWVKVGSSALDFQNGLTQSGNYVKLGGVLTESSAITQGAYSLNFNLSGTGDFNIQDAGTSAFFVRDNGNVGIGTTSPGQKFEVNGNLKLGDNIMLEGYSNYRVYRNLVSYSATTTTGAVVINTNQPMASGCMFRVKIEGYLYKSSGPFEIIIGAYTYSGGFANQGHLNIGSEKLQVRLAQDTSTNNMAIILGDITTSFPHPKLTVTEFYQGHNGRIENNAEGWTITQETDLSGFDHIENVPDRTNMDNRYYTETEVDNILSGENLWDRSSGNLYPHIITDNIGIGTTNPGSRLEVYGNESGLDADPLFEVKNNDGQTIFAVYPEGVRIYVDEDAGKGPKGGFAVGGFSSSKGTITNEYLRITPDTFRIYVDDTDTGKGPKGGFAVGGYSSSKGLTKEYLRVTPDSVRIYVKEGDSKGPKGGFAVGGYSSSKGIAQDLLRVSEDSTRIYVSDSLASGFAVSNIQDGDYSSLMDITTQNYFIGHEAGKSITGGKYNIFMGYQAGLSTRGSGTLWNGKFNNFIGFKSGRDNVGGGHNTFIGYQSGIKSTSDFNTFIGSSSGYFNESGMMNTYIGSQSGGQIHDGDNNVIIGMMAGPWVSDAEKNTIIGTWAGMNSDGSGNVFIGFSAGAASDGSNRLYIDNSSTSSPLIYGDFDSDFITINGTLNVNENNFCLLDNVGGGLSPDYYIYQGMAGSTASSKEYAVGIYDPLWVDGNVYADAYYTNSDKRFKKNIQIIDNSLTKVIGLKGVYYEWEQSFIKGNDEEPTNIKNEHKQEIGFIAQDIEKFLPEVVHTDVAGYKSVDYSKISALLVEAIKEQQKMIDELKQENSKLKSDLQNQIDQLRNSMELNKQ